MHEEEEGTSSSERGFGFMEIKGGQESGEIKLDETSKENRGWISRIQKVSFSLIYRLNLTWYYLILLY